MNIDQKQIDINYYEKSSTPTKHGNDIYPS